MVGVRPWSLAAGETGGGPAEELLLLRAAQAGDGAALERLVTPHKQPLFALCYGILGHPEDAEDAVQETFLRALRSLPSFRGEAAVRTWLFRIALNLCLNRKRDLRPTESWNEEQSPMAFDATSPEAAALRRLQVIEALHHLPSRQRAIFLLKVLEGWSLEEIAVAMGCNPIRVKNELAKARRALAEWQAQNAEEGTGP